MKNARYTPKKTHFAHTHAFMRTTLLSALLLLFAACLFGSTGAHAAPPTSRMQGEYRGQVPESFTMLASYGGVRTGNLNAAEHDTVYIFFDPICGPCKHLYRQSLQYGSRVAIKWLPVNVLFPNRKAELQAASVLVAGAAARTNFETVVAGGVPQVTVTSEMRAQLRQNEALLKALCQERGIAGRRVPMAFFLDRTKQRPETLPGLKMSDLYGAP